MPPAKHQHLAGIAFYDHELLIRRSIMHCDHVAAVFGAFDRCAARVARAHRLHVETRPDCCPDERHLGGRSAGLAARRIEQLDTVAQDSELEQAGQLAIDLAIHDRAVFGVELLVG